MPTANSIELQGLTFENFESHGRIGLGDHQAASLEYAFNQSKQFASSHNGWLVLHGKYGCGKTHLAAAIANFAVDNRIKTLFITVPDLLDSLRFAYNSGSETSFEERFDEIRGCPFLILDDFGTQNTTQWAQEKLFQIINYRYINRLPWWSPPILISIKSRDASAPGWKTPPWLLGSTSRPPIIAVRWKLLAITNCPPYPFMGIRLLKLSV